MDLDELRRLVCRHGCTLTPIREAVLDAVRDVESGWITAAEIAEHRQFSSPVASIRLQNALLLGLLEERELEGREKAFAVTSDGLAAIGHCREDARRFVAGD